MYINLKTRIITLLLCVLATTAAGLHAQPLTFYVSPNGNDKADGTTATANNGHGPFATLARARDEIRKRKDKQSLPTEGVIVELAAGDYFISQTLSFGQNDSGTSAHPVIYRGAADGNTVLRGDVQLTQPIEHNDIAKALLTDAARKHVLCFDLKHIGPDELPGFASGGAGFKGKRQFPLVLSQAGQTLTVSRWPNDSYAKTGEFTGPEVSSSSGRFKLKRSGIFHFDNSKLNQWSTEPDLWMYGKWYWPWADQTMPVKSIDTDAGTLALHDPDTYLYGYQADQPFRAINAISELDEPGEWAIDRRRRLLYVWPKFDIQKQPLQLAVTDQLLNLEDTQDIRFEHLGFKATRMHAIGLRRSDRVVFSACVIRQTGSWAMRILEGNDCKVLGCDMFDLGEGGVFIEAGDIQTLQPANHLVENCYIHHFGNIIATYRPAVSLNGVGNIARRNLIHDSEHAAILFDGNDHLIENNIIHDVLLHTSDAGAIYTCARNWAKRGTMIRHNLVHGLGKKLHGSGCRGIYLDDYTSGTTIDGNIVTMATLGIHIGGGQNNVITNNLLIQCDESMDLASRGPESFARKHARMGDQSRLWKRTESFPIDTPIWKEKYPDLRQWMDSKDPVTAHSAFGNTYANNIGVDSGNFVIYNKKVILPTLHLKDNIHIHGDPGFVDPQGLDFRFKSDSPILKQVPDFAPLPALDEMGLYPSPDRATPSRRFGPDVSKLPPFTSSAKLLEELPQHPAQRVEAGRIVVDGQIQRGEWNQSDAQPLTCNTALGKNKSDKQTQAWIATDGTHLLLAVKVQVDADQPLVNQGAWGRRDGLEFAFADPGMSPSPTLLVQCFPDGTGHIAVSEQLDQAHADKLTQQAMRMATSQQKDAWLCEVSLDLKALGFDTREMRRLLFNLNVRRMADASWMAWTPITSSFRDVQRAGLLVFPDLE